MIPRKWKRQILVTISSQTLCFEARRKCGVGFIHTQLASSHANAPPKLASSPSTVGFITRDFHALISRKHWQTNRRGLYTLFLTSIPDEAICSWLHQSHHCAIAYPRRKRRMHNVHPTYARRSTRFYGVRRAYVQRMGCVLAEPIKNTSLYSCSNIYVGCECGI